MPSRRPLRSVSAQFRGAAYPSVRLHQEDLQQAEARRHPHVLQFDVNRRFEGAARKVGHSMEADAGEERKYE
jgi:hypothetical protein